MMQENTARVKALYEGTLHDLGEQGYPELNGILSPLYDEQSIKRFMSQHYENSAEAQKQADSFNMEPYYRKLIGEAFHRVGFNDLEQKYLALDVGCGFGSTTLPLLELLPRATVIASEFSPAMLAMLRRRLKQSPHADRCIPCQLNAEELLFKQGTFDLVVGAAILHHLFEPEKVLSGCAHILKPGGLAIFFEPFEGGYSIMSFIYNEVLQKNPFRIRGRLDRKTLDYFRHSLSYWQKMKSRDKSDPFFKGSDDKWLFTRSYLEKLSAAQGFSRVVLFPHSSVPTPFRNLFKVHTQGNGITNLPAWVWEIVDHYEQALSLELKEDLMTEGGIVFCKA
ncbi:MAG: class I SAM-dependent methyltransferase [Myxococcales bacterium]|nr:MAG: class I SAM-dependent methyltransferase [Myxococcales bacterium]